MFKLSQADRVRCDSMVLGQHPEPRILQYAETELSPNPKFIGYWYRTQDDFLPDPTHFVDQDWDPDERNRIVEYLKASKILLSWDGFSKCRICEDYFNGSHCCTDGEWVWPEGFAHYIEKHGVKPPAEFIQKVLG